MDLFACRCLQVPSELLSKSELILEGVVVNSKNNKTLIEVTRVLSKKVDLDSSYIGAWFLFEGTLDRGTSCPGVNVEKKIGEKVMFFPALEYAYENIKKVKEYRKIIGACTVDYFSENSQRYKEVLDFILQ
jgi:hypothetical protein